MASCSPFAARVLDSPPPRLPHNGGGDVRRRAGREEKPRVALADALDLDGTARLDLDVLAQLLARDRADVDAARDRRALEPRREVYGVAPDVVAELLASDDAGH